MRSRFGLLAAICTAGILPSAAQATLLGQTVDGSLSTNYGTVTTPFAPLATVGPGVEFSGAVNDTSFNLHWLVGVDIGDSTISLTLDETNANGNGNVSRVVPPFDLLTVNLSGFTGLPAMSLLSYNCSSTGFSCGAFGGGPSIYALNSDASSFSVSLGVLRDGETYVFGATPAVPEPASWTLMIAGLGLAGGAMRSRRRQQPGARFAA